LWALPPINSHSGDYFLQSSMITHWCRGRRGDFVHLGEGDGMFSYMWRFWKKVWVLYAISIFPIMYFVSHFLRSKNHSFLGGGMNRLGSFDSSETVESSSNFTYNFPKLQITPSYTLEKQTVAILILSPSIL